MLKRAIEEQTKLIIDKEAYCADDTRAFIPLNLMDTLVETANPTYGLPARFDTKT